MLNGACSSYETIFMRAEKVRCPWNYCKTRNIVMLYLYDYTTTGIRKSTLGIHGHDVT
jgi:hypothetical protein